MVGRATIRAAGVVAVRDDGTVVLVRRPRRDDISLPKGKLHREEPAPVAAVRECREETGLRVRLGAPLGTHAYSSEGVPKTVDYWRAVVLEDAGFVPDDEVAEVMHRSTGDAAAYLTYPQDAELVRRAVELGETRPLVVLRHAAAVSRQVWAGSGDPQAGDDSARPLAPEGRRAADRLVALLGAYGVVEIRSSPSRRCRQTVAPYATDQGLRVAPDPRLSEEGHAHDASGVERAVAEALAGNPPLLLCTHRPVLIDLVRVLVEQLEPAPDLDLAVALEPPLATAAMLVLHRDRRGRVVAVERHHAD